MNKNITFAGSIISEMIENHGKTALQVGDIVAFDKCVQPSSPNGNINSLQRFKELLSEQHDYVHIGGEEFPNSICKYKIVGIKPIQNKGS